ncbi:MAG: chromosome partitioning protein ParB [Deltaproteobacteria bacterium CG_4_8_14_3_um_filter_45_9]|nr:MAG: chromosome partitioning protein ParB [Deltaproteobacteria bacterium CG03_land_8_20_14_0_80_45_14]PIX25460.1 MAG: chromosome partitioning protein ParB [Deltaproteobacteria bacterium CG_4_8_14_3_um_filter_45_9]
MATKRMALGKGLGALLPEFGQAEPRTLLYCGLEEIIPNRSQPRKHFDESKLQELAESIKEKGILEPLIVRRVDQGYELIIGERRWRAAQKAGLKEVPVIVKETEGREAFEISLIENLQREDLNPIEAAEAFKHLIEEFNISQENLSKRMGKDRTTITNTLRLLKLPLEIRNQLLQNLITSGHARAILSLENKEKQRELCALIIKKGLSVREAEALAKRWSETPKKKAASVKRRGDLESQLSSLQDSLRKYLGTKVHITQKDKKGKIEIEYYSYEDLERIVEAILKNA